MPFTASQVKRILDPDLIPEGRWDHRPARIVESWLRRRLFATEDKLVAQHWAAFRKAKRTLDLVASDVADFTGVGSTLDNGVQSRRWRDTMVSRTERILAALYRTISTDDLEWATQAYAVGFYGRLWQMSEMVNDVNAVAVPTLTSRQITAAVLREQMDTYDDLTRSLLGSEWLTQYQLELDDLILRIRRAFNRGMAEGLGIRETMRIVAENMGVEIDRRKGQPYRKNFNRVQVITRTVFNAAQNDGAFAAYEANRRLLSGVEWLTARDERVCPECNGLDGETWGFDDPDRRQPPAHPNCRCNLIPVLREPYEIPRAERRDRPRWTFREWLVLYGLLRTLGPFFGGRSIESERV